MHPTNPPTGEGIYICEQYRRHATECASSERIRVMLQFILRRLGLVIPTFIGITLLTFAFVHMIPGDPVMIMAGERGISLNVMRNCWLNSALISRCGSSISTISGACCTAI